MLSELYNDLNELKSFVLLFNDKIDHLQKKIKKIEQQQPSDGGDNDIDAETLKEISMMRAKAEMKRRN